MTYDYDCFKAKMIRASDVYISQYNALDTCHENRSSGISHTFDINRTAHIMAYSKMLRYITFDGREEADEKEAVRIYSCRK